MYQSSNVFILVGSVGNDENFTLSQIRHYFVVAKDAETAVNLVSAKFPDFRVATASSLEALDELKEQLDAVAKKEVVADFIDPDLDAVF